MARNSLKQSGRSTSIWTQEQESLKGPRGADSDRCHCRRLILVIHETQQVQQHDSINCNAKQYELEHGHVDSRTRPCDRNEKNCSVPGSWTDGLAGGSWAGGWVGARANPEPGTTSE